MTAESMTWLVLVLGVAGLLAMLAAGTTRRESDRLPLMLLVLVLESGFCGGLLMLAGYFGPVLVN